MQSIRSLLFFVILGIALAFTACAAPETPAPPTPTRTPRPTATPKPTSASPTIPITPSLAPSAATSPSNTPTSTATSAPTASPTPSVTPTMLGGCAEVWQSGFYKMYADFKTTLKRFDCMVIQASDVVIDCDGHTIEGLNKQGHGFWIRKYGFPFLQTPNNVEIRNCKVQNARDGVFAEAGTNLWIHDNDFSNNYDDTDSRRYSDLFLGLTEGGGIRLDNVQGALVENNKTNNAAIGIDVRNSDSVVIRNNTAANNSAWGVNLLNTQHSEVSANTLRDTVRYCTWGSGVVGPGCDAAAVMLQDGASHDVVKNNNITGQNANGVFIKAHGVRCGDDNLIQNNTITNAIYNAVEFSFCTGNKIIGNKITGSYDGVWFGFSVNAEVRNNVISNMRNHGISSFNSHGSIIADNQITNAREGILFSWDTYDPQQLYFLTPSPDNYASRDNAITNNALRDNVVAGIHLLNSIQNHITSNTFANNAKNVWIEGKNDGNVVAGQ